MLVEQLVSLTQSGEHDQPIEGQGVIYLDSGYYGNVYLLPCKEKVVKINRLDTPSNTRGVYEEVKQEFKVMQVLQGLPCIPKLYSYAESYGVMSYIKGISLAQMDDEDVYKIPKQEWLTFFNTLVKARERGVYHRDINSTNILVTNDYKLYLIDFGRYSFESRHQGAIPLPHFLQLEDGDVYSLRKPYQSILKIALTVYDFDLEFHEDYY